ncbi:MAG: ferritin family protein [Dehalococcoidia bacterium]|nr:ferritin family protein [Dehalococcoidia bacterium]
MPAKLTIKDVLERACQKEIVSQLLYKDLAQRMKKAEVAGAFKELVEQELGHQLILEKLINGDITEGALNPGDVVDYKIVERLDQPEVTTDMKLKDVFMLAAHREKASHELYLGLSRIHPRGQVGELLKTLAAQELEHKRRVEFLYTEVAFPQTDGG